MPVIGIQVIHSMQTLSFKSFRVETQQYNINTIRRNQESYMQTHEHKGFYQAVQWNY